MLYRIYISSVITFFTLFPLFTLFSCFCLTKPFCLKTQFLSRILIECHIRIVELFIWQTDHYWRHKFTKTRFASYDCDSRNISYHLSGLQSCDGHKPTNHKTRVKPESYLLNHSTTVWKYLPDLWHNLKAIKRSDKTELSIDAKRQSISYLDFVEESLLIRLMSHGIQYLNFGFTFDYFSLYFYISTQKEIHRKNWIRFLSLLFIPFDKWIQSERNVDKKSYFSFIPENRFNFFTQEFNFYISSVFETLTDRQKRSVFAKKFKNKFIKPKVC